MGTKQSLRVLFIDDDPNDVELIIRVLDSAEYMVIWKRVETESALLGYLTEKWDVILCDYSLPRFSAERALFIIKEMVREHPLVDIPFIVISGVVDESVAINLIKMGAHDFISKDRMQRLPLAIRREIRQSNERVKLRLHVEDGYEATIEAWGKALEIRDRFTSGHTERVAALALRLAMKLDVSRVQFVTINRGALLHDIGKMGIPDAILLKEGELTIEEMNVMKMHPILARDMLKNVPFLYEAVDIPFCHHERWNGSGYPQGLYGSKNPYSHKNPRGTGIPFTARLFSIVDVYDALTSDRPYRKSWDKARAIDYIIGERNITFDPYMVDTFVDMIGRG